MNTSVHIRMHVRVCVCVCVSACSRVGLCVCVYGDCGRGGMEMEVRSDSAETFAL